MPKFPGLEGGSKLRIPISAASQLRVIYEPAARHLRASCDSCETYEFRDGYPLSVYWAGDIQAQNHRSRIWVEAQTGFQRRARWGSSATSAIPTNTGIVTPMSVYWTGAIQSRIPRSRSWIAAQTGFQMRSIRWPTATAAGPRDLGIYSIHPYIGRGIPIPKFLGRAAASHPRPVFSREPAAGKLRAI